MGLQTVVGVGIGLAVLYLLISNLIMPFYNTAGDVNVYTNTTPTTGLGTSTSGIMTKATYQGILLLVFFLAIIGIALSFWKKK